MTIKLYENNKVKKMQIDVLEPDYLKRVTPRRL